MSDAAADTRDCSSDMTDATESDEAQRTLGTGREIKQRARRPGAPASNAASDSATPHINVRNQIPSA